MTDPFMHAYRHRECSIVSPAPKGRSRARRPTKALWFLALVIANAVVWGSALVAVVRGG